jgi:hypothetical protein
LTFDTLDSLGLSPHLSFVKSSTNLILAKTHCGHGSQPTIKVMGPLHFCQHYPRYFQKWQKIINVKQKHAHDVDEIDNWFSKFFEECYFYSIKVCNVLNIAELDI